jgi:UDPglucose 6-dehydrogenase
MKIAILGTGYVGLVTGTCLADCGNEVTCIDKDAGKISGLLQGRLPIYEPGLEELVERNGREGRLRFTTDLAEGLRGSQIVFICVGTPQSETGAADLSTVFAVAEAIAKNAEDSKLVVVKSTVPVGTNAKVFEILSKAKIQHRAASNPTGWWLACEISSLPICCVSSMPHSYVPSVLFWSCRLKAPR